MNAIFMRYYWKSLPYIALTLPLFCHTARITKHFQITALCISNPLCNTKNGCGFDRKKRLSELREAAKVARFGSVVPISGSDFVREVSQAPPDVWVVVILYKEGIAECGLLMQCLEDLATKYPATKFVKIISTDCIPNYPDRNLPTLLVYNSGAVKANHVGLRSFGRRCTPEGISSCEC